MLVSIVIVNRNSMPFVARLMETLITSCNKVKKCSEIIIVDNASIDKSPRMFEEYSKKIKRPMIKIIRLKRNYGFCYAVNVGVVSAQSELVAVLNPDLYVDDDWLVHILKAFEKSPRIGAVQPLIYWYQYPDRVQSKGLHADLIGNYKDNVFNAKAILAPFGAAYVVRRDAFIRVGGLDPYYFMYGDELDLGLRMWLAGWMVVLEPTSKVYHYMGGSTPSSDKFYILKCFLARRNQIITLLKDFSSRRLFLSFPLLLLVNVVRGVRSRTDMRCILAAYLSIARNTRFIVTKRLRYLSFKIINESKLHRWGILRSLL